MIGVLLVAGCLVLMIGYGLSRKEPSKHKLREIPAFLHLQQALGRAVEESRRIHVSIGRGGIEDVQGAPGLVGIDVIRQVLQTAATSDRPPLVTSGEGAQAILAEDIVRPHQTSPGGDTLENPSSQLPGLTPFSFAAGVLPLISDEHVSTSLLVGSFGSEVALLTEASERAGGVAIGGSENLDAQAILYASTAEPLVGEDLFAAGAYLQSGKMQRASLFTQDVLRWVIIAGLILGAVLKLVGVL